MTARERELELLVIDLAEQKNYLEKMLSKQKESEILLSELLKNFIHNKSMADTTKCGYNNIISNHLIPYFESVFISDLTTEMIDRYVVFKQNAGLSNQTIRHHLTVLKSAFTYARKKGMAITFKVETSVNLYIEPYKFEILTFNEINSLINSLKDNDIFLPILISSLLGLRRSEVVGRHSPAAESFTAEFRIFRTKTAQNSKALNVLHISQREVR